jgi:methylenetetrahydrofolate--tRNA-(uracil-5-)-methyltransferase
MKPEKYTPAHGSPRLAELVCSNSLRSDDPASGPGLLKAEMRRAGSVVLAVADRHRVPAGGALAVDRERFAETVEATVRAHPGITVESAEVTAVPDHPRVILATGPLTTDALASDLRRLTGEESMHFVDATAPIVAADSIDRSIVFAASRYGKGEAAYLNCPMTRQEYEAFVDALLAAEKVAARAFEDPRFFEGCMPIEEMARRGRDTLCHGPMKPVGLTDPRTGRRPYAVVQLRAETAFADLYNVVGFQTQMTWPEQRRVFRMIPGLEHAEFHRLGTLHRNTFVRAPRVLDDRLRLRADPRVRLAGQLSGIEGYIESAATGWLAGLFAAADFFGIDVPPPPPECAHGGLLAHLTKTDPAHFAPMNITFGLLPPPDGRVPKKERKARIAARGLAAFESWLEECRRVGLHIHGLTPT